MPVERAMAADFDVQDCSRHAGAGIYSQPCQAALGFAGRLHNHTACMFAPATVFAARLLRFRNSPSCWEVTGWEVTGRMTY